MDFKLNDHLKEIFMDCEDKTLESFSVIPNTIKSLIFYKTYHIMDNFFAESENSQHKMPDDPEFGRHSYLQTKDLQPMFHLKLQDRIGILTELIENLDQF